MKEYNSSCSFRLSVTTQAVHQWILTMSLSNVADGMSLHYRRKFPPHYGWRVAPPLPAFVVPGADRHTSMDSLNAGGMIAEDKNSSLVVTITGTAEI
jgi:hypothetical protein